MCGIYLYISKHQVTETENLKKLFSLIKHRGPDNSQYLEFETKSGGYIFLGFHRLCINDVSEAGNQPIRLGNVYLICNGEIYNYKELAEKYNFQLNSGSDCEIILHLYKKFGFECTINLLSGYFAFALYDADRSLLYVARDPIGVRSLFFSKNLVFSSEMKAIDDKEEIQQFPPGCYFKINTNDTSYEKFRYYDYVYPVIDNLSEQQHCEKIRLLFEKAVKKRFMSDRPIGVFLSGGLDSSLVASIVAKYSEKQISTFSIGLKGSTDLAKARLVAEHIKSKHTEVIVTEEEMLKAIPEVIRSVETYDTTTIRASTPMYLLSKYIKENTDIVVVFSGEGSDEASGSYLYFHNAPSKEAFQEECIRLLKDLCYFDCLRCDKSTAAHGLEVRVPFLDKEFLYEYMRIPSHLKMPKNGMEKWLLRNSFDTEDYKYLPDEVLWRKKEAFSDGVSGTEKSWFTIIQEYVDSIITDEEFNREKHNYKFNIPQIKESYYYRKVFESYYKNQDKIVPYYWLPKWSDAVDPSARKLIHYCE